MSDIKTSELIKQLHSADRSATTKNLVDLALFFTFSAMAVVLWKTIYWPVTILCWLVGGHFGHSKPLMFHDAAHGTLHSTRRANEIVGFGLGVLIFVPITVYRHAHSMHHAYLASLRDPELWPFTRPDIPRWQRVLAAAVEIVFGFIYTPLVMSLSLRHTGGLNRRDHIRIGLEYAACIGFWGLALTAVSLAHLWELFLVGWIAPVAVAGMYQTLNKYTEHLGLTGDSILANTRTVCAEDVPGQVLSYTLQHVDHHGTHHRFAKIPFYNLPLATPLVYDTESGPLFRSYMSAFLDMVKSLPDPKAGVQWRQHDAHTATATIHSGHARHDSHGMPAGGAC